MILAMLWGCIAPPAEIGAEAIPAGVEISATAPFSEVEIRSGDRVIQRQRWAQPVRDGWVSFGWTGPVEVRARFSDAWSGSIAVTPPKAEAIHWAIAAPYGQEPQPLPDRGEVRLSTTGSIALIGTAVSPGEKAVTVDGEPRNLRWTAVGEPQIVWVKDYQKPVVVAVEGEERWRLIPDARTLEAVRRDVEVLETVFPADVAGSRDASLSPDRVSLPSSGWGRWMRRMGLGFRPSDAQAPWAFEGVRLANHGEQPVTLVVQGRVLVDGHAALPFMPRLRASEAQLDAVSVLVRIPAGGEGVAVLPVFVDREGAVAGAVNREVEIRRLGDTEALQVVRRDWIVQRGSGVAAAGLWMALAAMFSGAVLVLARLERWLTELPTSVLATIALFSTVQLAIGLTAQLVATVVTTAIGPLAPLLTGLVDEIPRMLVLVTLLTLAPRPGVLGLSVLVGGILRLFATGSASVVDLVYILSSVAWLEAFAWISGLTRSSAWTDEAWGWRTLRLGFGLGSASVLQAATAMAVHTALYRLFYAPWYVVAVLALPSWLYVVIACGIAAPFAASLRKVQP